MPVDDAPQVVAAGLGHRFTDGPWLFSELDLALRPNRTYALVGPSGSGKSTLLSILAGWVEPATGSLRRDGIDSIAWVFQNPLGVARRTAEDHVALPLLARGHSHRSARVEARTMLARVGLSHVASAPFANLSGGEAQRLMLARGLASRPDMLLVDEPTAQLDTTTAEDVNRAIAASAGHGSIVVIATHDRRTRDACTDVIELGRSA
ncbi:MULTISPECIES: ATP-binding cassette domain-containing protein [Leifsonia]|uniref:ABC-type lipoprotein export system ATPase subunit n=1 Tax=Leifsonia soli TaxID=582665 RepID=A0A852SY36_9MICO|nr:MULTISPECIES: ATP-binding cassette domain-containing protein [Leifsonia]NYD74078.1 ABC-type lipoprotein export system ATPase subunit [Leifsonia soli]SEA65517.1 putative ABC transport system ATP-binding protein [Leifsonia sp. 21MFCrub1.1]